MPTMWPPPLLDDRPTGMQVLLAFVVPAVFGGICGYVLGHSESAYTILTTLAVIGGISAGFEHVGADEGVRRGFVGGGLFAVSILVVHAIEGSTPPFDLPAPLGVLAIVYFLLGMAFGALGGWLRARRATVSP
jgi:hypothetical protein